MRVTRKKPMRTKRLIDVMQQPDIFNVIKRCITSIRRCVRNGFLRVTRIIC